MAATTACGTCGLIQTVDLHPGTVAKCARCGFTLMRSFRDSRLRTFALALGALILYFPANIYPIVTTVYWGMRENTTILDGIRSLFQQGNYFVASLIFTTSILTPLLKILGLLMLSVTLRSERWNLLRTRIYRTIQFVDPWNMLEVTMLAILVSLAEMGQIATVHPGPGVFSFAGVVVLTISATLTFDPRWIWTEGEPGNDPGFA